MILSKLGSAPKYVLMLLAMSAVTILITFGLLPRAENHKYSYQITNNEGTVEVVSMFTRFMATPLLFLCKFLVKSLVYKGRTVVIKMPLVRHVMPKRELRDFLRRRGEDRFEEAELHRELLEIAREQVEEHYSRCLGGHYSHTLPRARDHLWLTQAG